MENSISKTTICNNFSRNAHSYDDNNDVQNEAARMLIKRLPVRKPGTILEIGCGTGNYTQLLRDAFRKSRIEAIDISDAMIKLAEKKLSDGNTVFWTADAETAEFNRKFDLVTSNAVFHWLGDLESMSGKLKDLIKEDGAVTFSIFGPKTFLELKKSIMAVAGKDVPMTADNFYDKEKIGLIFRKHFKDVRVTERIMTETYPSLTDLLRKVKYSGTRGRGAGLGKLWSPGFIKKIENKYMECFGTVEATYQIFFCEAFR